MQWVPWGGVWSIFQLILCEKNFLELGDPACLLDWGSAVSMLWRWMGGLCGFGGVRCRILIQGFQGKLNINYRGNSMYIQTIRV